MTNRMDHTNCFHTRNLAGRTVCRRGTAILTNVRENDMVKVDGCWIVVRRVFISDTLPFEVQDNASREWFPAYLVTAVAAR